MNNQREGSGILFPNERRKSEKAPDYTGTIFLNGHGMELSAWTKLGAKGQFLSVQVREPWKPQGNSSRRSTPSQVREGEALRARLLKGE
ncbi:hypothetical protein [Novacetimonas maltaceti]|uniref:hypothetical protein n=1 Tax=Novacetimonas maltaceti TaxID=1203393 RepID=UPI0011AF6160|nr:hypothetical protein [Novacetimonas maltaceti]